MLYILRSKKLKPFNLLACIPKRKYHGRTNFTWIDLHAQKNAFLFLHTNTYHSARRQLINQNYISKHYAKYSIYYCYPLENLFFPRIPRLIVLNKFNTIFFIFLRTFSDIHEKKYEKKSFSMHPNAYCLCFNQTPKTRIL